MLTGGESPPKKPPTELRVGGFFHFWVDSKGEKAYKVKNEKAK